MIELANIAASFVAYGLYEIYLKWVISRKPMKLARSAHATIRSNWVKSVMRRSGTEILVIQTLRNSVMAASFMATTAILALSGSLTLSGIFNPDTKLWRAVHAGDVASIIFAAKLLLLVGSFFTSFLFMAMAVRFFNHAGYLITGEIGQAQPSKNEIIAISYLNRAGNCYSLGMRAFFACVPFLAGLFSSYLMFPATCFLIWILYWFDRLPDEG